MHILLDYRPALRQRTGVGEYVHHLASSAVRQLGPAGQVTLFSSSWKDRLAQPIAGARTLDRRIPVRALNFLWHRLEWPPIETLGGKADVVWALHPLMIPSRRAAQVVSLMDLHVFEHPELTSAEIRRDYAALAPSHLKRADAVITISEYTRRRAAERFGIPREKITVCYPGSPAWSPRPDAAPDGPILHVGTLEPRKNIPALLRAYAELLQRRPNAPPLVFAGRVQPFVSLLPPSTSEALQGRVRYLGYVSEDEKLRLYREASMLVVASTDEGFGIPAVEAMTLGVPVVATIHGALPEVVGEAAILADPSDTTAYAAAMERVLSDASLRRQLRDRGIQQASRFRWDTSARTLLETFRGVVARHAARRTR